MLLQLTIITFEMTKSGVTTESGGRQNMFPSETRPYIDETVSYDGYPQNAEKVNGRWAMVGFVALLGAYVTTGQIIPGIFQFSNYSFIKLFVNRILFNSFKQQTQVLLKLKNLLFEAIFQFKSKNKKNQIKVIAFRLNIIPKNIYANFLPINAVSGSSFTLIKFSNYIDKDSIN